MATPIVKPGYREFTATKLDGSKLRLSIRLPNQKDLQSADLEASGAFNRALEAGLPTRQRMVRKLRSNGLWSDELAGEVDTLREELGKLEGIVRKNAYTAEQTKEQVNARRSELQQKLGELRTDFESMLAHTSDAKSDEAKRNFLVACTAEHVEDDPAGLYKKGQRVFGSVSNYLNEPDKLLTQRCGYEFMAVENDMPSEWTAAEENAAKEEAEKKALEDAQNNAKDTKPDETEEQEGDPESTFDADAKASQPGSPVPGAAAAVATTRQPVEV